MICPNCDGELKVLDTISAEKHNYRKRKCYECGFIFYTTESVGDQDEPAKLFSEWSTERSRKARAKKKGLVYEPKFSDGREKQIIPKKPTSPLF